MTKAMKRFVKSIIKETILSLIAATILLCLSWVMVVNSLDLMVIFWNHLPAQALARIFLFWMPPVGVMGFVCLTLPFIYYKMEHQRLVEMGDQYVASI